MPPEVSEIIEVVDADNDDKIDSPRKSATKKMSHRHRHRHYSNEWQYILITRVIFIAKVKGYMY